MLTRGIKYLDSFEQTTKNVKIYFLSHKDLFSGKWNYRIEKTQSHENCIFAMSQTGTSYRSDSNQGTDYIVNYFSFAFKGFRINIENLKWQIGKRHYSANLQKIFTIVGPETWHNGR